MPRFLTYRNYEESKHCWFKPLSFGVIFYAAIDNWYSLLKVENIVEEDGAIMIQMENKMHANTAEGPKEG